MNNNNELNELRNDSSEYNEQPKSKNHESDPMNSAGQTENTKNVYSIRGHNIIDSRFTPHANTGGQTGSSGSETVHESVHYSKPDSEPPKKKAKRNNAGKVGLIAAVIVAAMMLAVVSGFIGAMLATRTDGNPNNTVDSSQNYAETHTPVPDSSGSNKSEDNTVIIIKNNKSETVETVKGNIGDTNLEIPDVVSLVKDSVVEIFTESSTYNGRYVTSGAGSGVIIGSITKSNNVYIVTNNHVIDGASKITVRLTNGSEYSASLKGTDPVTDIAVLMITIDENYTMATLGSSENLRVGETVIAIGNPLGELGGSVTNGIISALSREVEIDGNAMTLLQTSAAINPGNSGGGLFNMRGELIGIVNAKSSGSTVDNIGFAIPIDIAYEIVRDLIEYGYVTGRVDAGLELINISTYIDVWRNNVEGMGVYVKRSLYTDEIKYRDRIVSVNGTAVSTKEEFDKLIGNYAIGDTVTIRVSRDGNQIDVKLTLREYKPESLLTD